MVNSCSKTNPINSQLTNSQLTNSQSQVLEKNNSTFLLWQAAKPITKLNTQHCAQRITQNSKRYATNIIIRRFWQAPMAS